jgi:predicted nucleic acid-binding protein
MSEQADRGTQDQVSTVNILDGKRPVLITYVDVKGRFAIIKLDQISRCEISEIRFVAWRGLCVLLGARTAHNEPFGMATKHPERRQGQGCGRSLHPKGMALMLPGVEVGAIPSGHSEDQTASRSEPAAFFVVAQHSAYPQGIIGDAPQLCLSCRLARADFSLVMRFDGVYAVIMISLVIDTNVFVAGLRSAGGASREVLRRALTGRYEPLFGNALWLEYRDLLDRPVWGDTTSVAERLEVLAALAQCGRWVTVYYGWRPNLPDEGDNHLIELALAGNARAIVTHNVRDVSGGELHLGTLRVLTPAQCLEEWQ